MQNTANIELFTDRLHKVNIDRLEKIREDTCKNEEACRDILDTVNTLCTMITSNIASKIASMTRFNTSSCALFTIEYGVNDTINDKILSPKGIYIDVKYLLSGRWLEMAKKKYPEEAIPVEDRIHKYVIEHCNKGIDPMTNNKYMISVLWSLRDTSKIQNGVYISRNGLRYGYFYTKQKNDDTFKNRDNVVDSKQIYTNSYNKSSNTNSLNRSSNTNSLNRSSNRRLNRAVNDKESYNKVEPPMPQIQYKLRSVRNQNRNQNRNQKERVLYDQPDY
jgi:hypothetical protein